MRTGHRELPNLFIIGAPKCGTTAVHSALSRVPGFQMSQVKEPAFFSNDQLFSLGVDYYIKSCFPSPSDARFRGEATPWYLYSTAARRRIHEVLTEVPSIIVLVREPIRRAISMYADQVGAGLERRTIEEAFIEELDALAAGRSWSKFEQRYLEHGRYMDFIRGWVRTYGRQCLAVLPAPGEAPNEELWSRLSAHLSHDLGRCELDFNSAQETNAGGRVRFSGVFKFSRWAGRTMPGLKRGVRRLLPAGFDQRVTQSVRRHATVREGEFPVLSEELAARLVTWYEPACSQLRDEFGIEFRPLGLA